MTVKRITKKMNWRWNFLRKISNSSDWNRTIWSFPLSPPLGPFETYNFRRGVFANSTNNLPLVCGCHSGYQNHFSRLLHQKQPWSRTASFTVSFTFCARLKRHAMPFHQCQPITPCEHSIAFNCMSMLMRCSLTEITIASGACYNWATIPQAVSVWTLIKSR
jgi:hypothetical protein